MRMAHYLTKSEGAKRPKNIVFFDTETNIVVNIDGSEFHTLKLGCALHTILADDGQLVIVEDCRFYDYETFIDFIVRLANKHDKIYVVSHNIIYDTAATHMLVELPIHGYRLQSLYSKATTTILKLMNHKRTIWLVDNSNYFVGTLASLGSLVDLPKLDIDFALCTLPDLMTYCERDVRIVYRLWQLWFDFIDAHDIGNFRLTASSTAFEAFRHRFMSHSIAIHDNEDVIKLERKAYHGGRVECKFLGYVEGDIYYLDVNSMYPYVMSKFMYPYALRTGYDYADVDTLSRWLETYAVIATVRLCTDSNPYPCIYNTKLCYPTGDFTATLCTPELQYAIEHNHIVEVLQCAYYSQSLLFADFVKYFYAMRQRYKADGNKPFEQLVKLMLNGVYGKFGQKELTQKILAEGDPEHVGTLYGYDIDEGQYWQETWLGGMLIRTTEGDVAYNAFPAIAAHVTAYARMYLWSLIERVTPGHYYYCDTDSLIVDNQGYRELAHMLHDTDLGSLKIEQQSSWLGIMAPKSYNMEGRFKLKGVSKSAHYVGALEWKQQRWPKLGSMIAHYGVTDYKLFPCIKHVSFANETVIPSASGWTSPLRLAHQELA